MVRSGPGSGGAWPQDGSGLWEYWLIRGLARRGSRLAGGRPGASDRPCPARAAALTGLAVFASLRGEFQRGGELFAASIALYEQAGDLPGQARALAILGNCAHNHGDHAGAAEAFDRAMLLAGRGGDPGYLASPCS